MHLSLECIIDLLEGRSEDSHPEQCRECQQRMDQWRPLLARLRPTQLTDAPSKLLKEAYAIVDVRPGAGIGKVLASLVFDSFAQPAFAGARGAGASRQLVLRAADFDVHIRLSGKPESRQITGQIMNRAKKGFVDLARVHLLQNGQQVQSSDLDSLGEFEFQNTAEGPLSLQIDMPNLTVIGTLGNDEVA